MGDFPPPRRKEPYRAFVPAANEPAASPAPRVVKRAEPPADDPLPRRPAPELTKDEVRALLAVTRTTRPKPWVRSARRAGIIIVPTGAISLLIRLIFGDYEMIAQAVLVIAALIWIARPLFAGRDEGW